MSAKVQTVESFEAVCFECDWYGDTHDDDSAAHTDMERHNERRPDSERTTDCDRRNRRRRVS